MSNYSLSSSSSMIMMIMMMIMDLALYYNFVKERTGPTDKSIDGSCMEKLYLPTHPPCYVIVALASSHDYGVSCIRNPA